MLRLPYGLGIDISGVPVAAVAPIHKEGFVQKAFGDVVWNTCQFKWLDAEMANKSPVCATSHRGAFFLRGKDAVSAIPELHRNEPGLRV